MKKVIVIGGGCAGLAAAYSLAKKGYEVCLIEKEDALGGLSRSTVDQNFFFDYGPHAYHIKGTRVDELFIEIMGENLQDKIISQKMVIRGRYLTYPLVLYELVSKLNPFLVVRILCDYLLARLWYAIFPLSDHTFRNWGVKRFGWTLYRLNFGQYTKRIWGLEPSKISSKLASQKLHKLNVKDIIKKLLGGKGEEQHTYWRRFWYPENGMKAFFTNFEKNLLQKQVAIYKNVREFQAHGDGRGISMVSFKYDNEYISKKFNYVVSSVHPRDLLGAMRTQNNLEIIAKAGELKYRSIILVNLIYDERKIMKDHWIYLLDPSFKCNRVTEQKNMGRYASPQDKTYLSFELCCNEGDEVWNMNDSQLLNYIQGDIDRLDFLKDRKYETSKILRYSHAYPVYALGFDNVLSDIFSYLVEYENLYPVGRMGIYLNSDMHDSMEIGLMAADCIDTNLSTRLWYEKMEHYLSGKIN